MKIEYKYYIVSILVLLLSIVFFYIGNQLIGMITFALSILIFLGGLYQDLDNLEY